MLVESYAAIPFLKLYLCVLFCRICRTSRKCKVLRLPAFTCLTLAIWLSVQSVNHYIADSGTFDGILSSIWNVKKSPNGPSLWDANVLYSEKLISEINHPRNLLKRGKELIEKALIITNITTSQFVTSHSDREIQLAYPPFKVSEPKFITEADRAFFWGNKLNNEFADITNKASPDWDHPID